VKQFKIILAIVLLISSIVLLVIMLFNQKPIQIILETGQEVVSKDSNYFNITTVMILIISSFLIGASIMYLFYNAEGTKVFSGIIQSTDNNKKKYDLLLPLLREDEKKAVRLLREANGEMLQNQLVLKLGLSKVKTTRLIASLERKQIVSKQRHGLTNSIKLN
jgi:uncharacterized membrane protein